MSSPTELHAQSVPPRDRDELEGSLLASPPLAQVVSVEDSNGVPYASAVAAGNVHYAGNDVDDRVASERVAFLPSTSSTYSADAEKFRVSEGQAMGRIAAQREHEALRIGLQRTLEQHRSASAAARDANEIARRRDSEGLQVRSDARLQQRLQKRIAEKSQQQRQYQTTKSDTSCTKGYQVKEYQMSEYSTSDYNISEYKSIYD